MDTREFKYILELNQKAPFRVLFDLIRIDYLS